MLVGHNTSHVIQYSDDEIDKNDTTKAISSKIHNMDTNIHPPYQICLSPDPFDNLMKLKIKIKGSHSTLGLDLITHQEFGHRLQLRQCLQSKPAAKIPKWRF